ncbi:MAG: type II toxin-antitoxin system RelE family toxin [Limisphaerales bacterium]
MNSRPRLSAVKRTFGKAAFASTRFRPVNERCRDPNRGTGIRRRFFPAASTDSALVQKKIDSMSLRLATFPHYRMTGSDKYRLRVGDYRVVYRFDSVRGEVYLLAIGHRREIYRE